jgi:hypothetical protein
MDLSRETEKLRIGTYIPQNTTLVINWKPISHNNQFVPKDSLLGTYQLPGHPNYEIKNKTSGKLVNLSAASLCYPSDKNFDEVIIAEVEPCRHDIVWEGTCTVCFEQNIKNKLGQRLFDGVKNLNVSGEMLEEKIDKILESQKLIMILDLDNTIIHAVPIKSDFDYEKELGTTIDDKFEIYGNSDVNFLYFLQAIGLDQKSTTAFGGWGRIYL